MQTNPGSHVKTRSLERTGQYHVRPKSNLLSDLLAPEAATRRVHHVVMAIAAVRGWIVPARRSWITITIAKAISHTLHRT